LANLAAGTRLRDGKRLARCSNRARHDFCKCIVASTKDRIPETRASFLGDRE
jgi:hypothetical protein